MMKQKVTRFPVQPSDHPMSPNAEAGKVHHHTPQERAAIGKAARKKTPRLKIGRCQWPNCGHLYSHAA
jgi:hypothetical protein